MNREKKYIDILQQLSFVENVYPGEGWGEEFMFRIKPTQYIRILDREALNKYRGDFLRDQLEESLDTIEREVAALVENARKEISKVFSNFRE